MKSNLLQSDSAKKNFAYQFIYQAVILVVPFLVSPYLTRTMGSTSLGIYTYTYSIAYYFVITAALGINRYGQRIIAQKKKDILDLERTFWSLFTLHVVVSIIVFIAYIIYAVFICNDNKSVALAQGIYVFSAVVDITWLFYGLEKFKTIAIRNAFIKVLEAACIFAFVKSPNDLLLYTLIMSCSLCLSQIVVWPMVVGVIKPVKISRREVFSHFKPMMVLFASTVAATLYTVFDKTLLGVLSTTDNVAFYEYSNRIITLPKTFIVIISTVLFPRACKMAVDNNTEGLRVNFNYSLLTVSFIGFASIFGLIGIGEPLVTLYYGTDFSACGAVAISMSPLIYIIGLGEAVRNQYVFPFKKDNYMVAILSTNAVINLILTAILIPQFGIYGAVAGSMVAEMFGLVMEIFICREYICVKDIFSKAIPFAVIGVCMLLAIKGIGAIMPDGYVTVAVQFVVGAFVYILLTIVYGMLFDETIKDFLVGMRNRILKRIHK